MPHHSGSAIALGARGLHRGLHRLPDGVELMIPGHLLHHRFPIFLKDDEVAKEIQEPLLVKDPLEEHLQLGHGRRGQVLPLDGAPGREPFPRGGQGSEAGFQAIGHHQEFVVGEEGGNLLFIGLESD